MSHYKIAVVIGSLRRDSFNRKLAAGLAKLAPPEFSLQEVQIGDLPLYNQDDDACQASSVKRLKAEIAASQGLLFFTPGVQSLHSRRAQECDRPRLTALRPGRLGRQTGGRHRHPGVQSRGSTNTR